MSASFAGLTLDKARRAVAQRFRAASLDSPELDARLLLGFVVDMDLSALVRDGARDLSEADAARLHAAVERRLAGEPVALIVGEKEFWGLRLRVTRDTLIPRPDTETVVAAALDVARGLPHRSDLRLADIGTGSGAILLALLSELPTSRGIGTDIAPAALNVAKVNAERLGFAGRVDFVASDYLVGIDGPFDIIVSNPPYIRTADLATLSIEVRVFEPRLALDGGPDGLTAYRTLARQAAGRLRGGGALIVEVGHDQADDVSAIFAAEGLSVNARARRDLNGIPRVVEGRKLNR